MLLSEVTQRDESRKRKPFRFRIFGFTLCGRLTLIFNGHSHRVYGLFRYCSSAGSGCGNFLHTFHVLLYIEVSLYSSLEFKCQICINLSVLHRLYNDVLATPISLLTHDLIIFLRGPTTALQCPNSNSLEFITVVKVFNRRFWNLGGFDLEQLCT